MKAVFHNQKKQRLLVLVITLVCAAFLASVPAWGIEPGVSIILSAGDNVQDPTFILGSAVKLQMIIKNDTNFPVNTERGFSKLEPHRFLVLIDPQGTHHVVGGTVTSGDAPPPFFLGDRTAVPAESIPALWNKKVTIEDLSKLFPVIKENIGWYKLEAHMPFVRLVWTLQHEQLGLLGIADDERNFAGTVDSNQVQFHVVLAPDAKGAHFKVQLLDQSNDPSTPINQAPVRAYEKSAIDGLALEDIWARGPDYADLNGITNTEGWVIWDKDLCKLQNNYTIVAYYHNEYQTDVLQNDAAGWLLDCAGVLVSTMVFGEPPPVVAGNFSVFGLNSVKIGSRAVVLGGDIGVKDAISSSDSGVSVLIESRAQMKEGVGIFADSVRIENRAVVYDIYYNELENKGQILGEMITPLKLPVWELPAFLESVPGKKDIKVEVNKKANNYMELAAGAYGEVKIEAKQELRLLGGTYHFKNMKLDENASLTCLGSVTILIEGDLKGDGKTYIGPNANSAIKAEDIVVYIGGGKVVTGENSKVIANIYAPNSTLKIEEESQVEGSFIAKDVIIDDKATVEYNSAF